MSSHRSFLPLALLLLVALAGCSAPLESSTVPEPATEPPLALAEVTTDPSCPASVSLKAVPERVVTMDAGAAAFIIELGFGDRIVGTAAPSFKNDFSGELRQQLDAIPVIDSGQGSAEAVIAAEPDLVTGISQYEFGGFDGTASIEQLKSAGSAALSACGAVQNRPLDNIDETFRYIAALAEVFDVPERGEALIAELRGQISVTEAATSGDAVPVLTLSSVPDVGTGVATHGGSSFTNGVVTLAGGKNIAINELQNFANLSSEAVAVSDPQVIVVVSGFSSMRDEDLKSAILASPLLAGTSAVKTGNVVTVPQHILLSPSMLNTDAVNTIANAVAHAR